MKSFVKTLNNKDMMVSADYESDEDFETQQKRKEERVVVNTSGVKGKRQKFVPKQQQNDFGDAGFPIDDEIDTSMKGKK